MIWAALAMTAGVAHAENVAQKNQVVTTHAKAAVEAVKLSADEQAFVAKLNDQHRSTFCEKFSAEQRQAAMVAEKNGAVANDAVAHLLAAQELKSNAAIADAAK